MTDLISIYIPDKIDVSEYSFETREWSKPREIIGNRVAISVEIDKKKINYIAFFPPRPSIGLVDMYYPEPKENTFANDIFSSFECREYMYDTVRKVGDFIGKANVRISIYGTEEIAMLEIKTISDEYTMIGLFCVDHKYE